MRLIPRCLQCDPSLPSYLPATLHALELAHSEQRGESNPSLLKRLAPSCLAVDYADSLVDMSAQAPECRGRFDDLTTGRHYVFNYQKT